MRKPIIIILVLSVLLSLQSVFAVDKAQMRWLRKKPLIDSIVINGNDAFSDSEIGSRMYSRR